MKINKNFLATSILADELAKAGIEHVCLSPGSRNTPITAAFALNNNFTTHLFIDERTSGFFALGLAKATGKPVVLVTTSGTATVELYPAIVEAFMWGVPLIVCTADRPAHFRNTGANQTINQENLFKNHIKGYFSPGLPIPNEKRMLDLRLSVFEAIALSQSSKRGPVHINLEFEKPLEPSALTDEISDNFFAKTVINENAYNVIRDKCRKKIIDPIALRSLVNHKKWLTNKQTEFIKEIIDKVEAGTCKTLIIVGGEVKNEFDADSLLELAKIIHAPIFADINSGLRFRSSSFGSENIISNYDSFLRNNKYLFDYHPNLILQFGRPVLSTKLEEFLSHQSASRFIINSCNEWVDPTKTAKGVIGILPQTLIDLLLERVKSEKNNLLFTDNRVLSDWLSKYTDAEAMAEINKKEFIDSENIYNEPCLVSSVIDSLPTESNLFLSNSTTIRDFDSFSGKTTDKEINIYSNRGASGIDGIISTASGIQIGLNKGMMLIIGDLSFYYDLMALDSAIKEGVSMLILLINNNGGGLFQALPIKNDSHIFEKYFKTPINFNFGAFINALNINYLQVDNVAQLQETVSTWYGATGISVVEIKTSEIESEKLRAVYRDIVVSAVESGTN